MQLVLRGIPSRKKRSDYEHSFIDVAIGRITTALSKSGMDAREGRTVLVWEKVKAPTQ
jgi:hypothetical protein